jgi:hypothetical protein
MLRGVHRWLLAPVIAAGLVLGLVLPLSLAGAGVTRSVSFHYVPFTQICTTTPSHSGGSLSAKQVARVRSLIARIRQAKSQEEVDRLIFELACYAGNGGAKLVAAPSGAAEIIPAGTSKSTIILTQSGAGMH